MFAASVSPRPGRCSAVAPVPGITAKQETAPLRSFTLALSAVAGFWLSGLAAAADPGTSPAEAKVLAVCQACHGPVGDSETPAYPRLNGQQAGYIAEQLKRFRDRKRDDTHARAFMWGTARGFDESLMTGLGAYFARQKPTPPQTGGALAAEGEKLFANGDQTRGLLACQQCHGKAGEGSGVMPRVAGQHSAYLRMMLGVFRSGLRRNAMMSAAAKSLTDHQIEALSSYLAND